MSFLDVAEIRALYLFVSSPYLLTEDGDPSTYICGVRLFSLSTDIHGPYIQFYAGSELPD